MAISLVIEEDRGTFSKRPRRHNGYYGGDFGKLPCPSPATISASPNRPNGPQGRP